MPRFVILEHRVGESLPRASAPVHWDWMFEVDGSLRTWATKPIEVLVQGNRILPDRPATDGPLFTFAQQLPDHRLAYLDIQGDIGGNRGTVKQLLTGECMVMQDTVDVFEVQLNVSGDTNQRKLVLQRLRGRDLEVSIMMDDTTVDRPWSLRLESSGGSFGE